MIIVKIFGGLGNQMFQYAAARSLSIRHSTELKLDVREFENYGLRQYGLNHLNIKESFATKQEVEKLLGENKCKLVKLLQSLRMSKLAQKIKLNNCLLEEEESFSEAFYEAQNNIYLKGYWQSEKYFLGIKDILKQEMLPKKTQSFKEIEMARLIERTNSASIHFRRTDYITNPIVNQRHGVCELSYYLKAVETLAAKLRDPHFFIFSDDPTWVKQNFNIDFPTTFVSRDLLFHDYEEMYLMSRCKHNIIANSSFSWWGAWLNDNPRKNVVAPGKWYQGNTVFKIENLIPAEWIVI